MLYRRKPELVHAEQWFPGRLLSGVANRPNGPSVDTLCGWHRLQEGDWILTEPDGVRYVLSDAYFSLSFAPVEV